MKKKYLHTRKNAFRIVFALFLSALGFSSNLKAQTYSKSILVNLGSNTCGSTTPYISLVDKSTAGDPVILNCAIPSTIATTYNNAAVEYNAKDNFIYLAQLIAGSTNIYKYDVGLASQVFSCPVLTTPTYTYNYPISNFSIDQNGDVYTISNYDAAAGTATFTKITLSTGAVLVTQTVQFPAADKPTSLGNGDLTFVANGKLYVVFQSGTTTSKLYEITNYGVAGTATAVFLKDIPNIINGLAFINDQLQLSGISSAGATCYTYLYDIATGNLGTSSNYPNGYAPADHTSIYTSIGSTKRLINNTRINANTSDIEYELYLQNTGNVSLQEVQFKDNLAAVFGAANISNLNVSIINNPSNLTLNPAYNGTTNINLLNTGQSLTNLVTSNYITIKVKLRATNIIPTQTYNNQGVVSGYVGTPSNNVQVSDLTNDGPPSAIYPLGSDTPTPFKALIPFANCPTTMFLTQYPAVGGTSLYTLNNVTNPLTITQVGTTTGGTVQLNGIGFNPLDNFIYGINNYDDGVNPKSCHLFIVDANNVSFDLGTVSGLPTGAYISGDIDAAGNYYVKENSNPATKIYKINITTKVATLINLVDTSNNPVSVRPADITYSVIDNLLYGVTNTTPGNASLFSINPTSGLVKIIGDTGGVTSFGAMYSDGVTGAIYGNANSAVFYSLNKTTGLATKVSNSIATVGNDGAHCVNSPILFGAELSITKTDGKTQYTPGMTNTYTVVVSNAGPFTAINANIKDAIPAGIPASNISYTSAVQPGGTSVILSGGSGTGAINSFANIQKGESITYTITLTVPLTYTGNLVNTATVAVSADNVEANTSNNSATDTDTGDRCYTDAAGGTGINTNHGITLLKRAGGSASTDWPMVRKSAFTALESNSKGFVITRMTTAQINAIVLPQEGMMVFDLSPSVKCLKIYSDGAWSCFSTPACP